MVVACQKMRARCCSSYECKGKGGLLKCRDVIPRDHALYIFSNVAIREPKKKEKQLDTNIAQRGGKREIIRENIPMKVVTRRERT